MADTVDAYIAKFSKEVQLLLQQLRRWIQEEAPEATEEISYGMPAYKLKGPLVYFGAAKKHIGLYPTSSGIAAFQSRFEACGLKYSKGAVQLPMDRELPEQLIRDIVRQRKKTLEEK